jgi:hypothetical protein
VTVTGALTVEVMRRSCRKVPYVSEFDARYALLKIWAFAGPDHQEIRHYVCDRCGLWHLTSQPA